MRILLIALLIISPSLIFAQSNYHAGYVIKNNGDTLKGFVNYKEWSYSPQSVEFKAHKGDKEPEQLTPATIKGFNITGLETYISYLGPISTNKNIFPDLPNSLDTVTQVSAVFLKQLATGQFVTLYYNNEVSKNRFFIVEKGSAPVEMKYYEYYANSNSQEVFDNIYRGQLLLIINKFNSGDQKLKSKVEGVKFNEPDLVEIVNEINNNGAMPLKQAKTAGGKSSVRLFAGAGLNFETTRYNYSASLTHAIDISTGYEVVKQNRVSYTSTTASPKINAGIDIFVNPNVQQFIFRAEVSFSYADIMFNNPVVAVNNTTTNYNYAATQYNASLMPQAIYNFYNTDKLKFYADAGAAVTLSSYKDKTTGANQTPLKMQSIWASYFLQTGVVLNKKIEVFVSYSTFTQISDLRYVDFSIANQSSTLGVKYLF